MMAEKSNVYVYRRPNWVAFGISVKCHGQIPARRFFAMIEPPDALSIESLHCVFNWMESRALKTSGYVTQFPHSSLRVVFFSPRRPRHWSIKRTRNQTHNNSHFWFWPLRKAFRLWWRTFDLTNCTSTLYHHLDSSWHVPFTNVDRSGVWMRIELVWPVICSASATSITSSIILMLACGIVSGCGVSSKWVWLIRPILIPVSGSADLSLAWESSDKPDQFVLINTHAFINRISEFTIIKQNEPSALPPLEANQNLIKIPFILEAMDF